jgi:flagellar biosynthesis protein FlhF
MPTITVQAADSATAMDEIWEKLGPDAMIISTSKRNGRIVMEATTESTKPAIAPSVEAGFSDIFKGQMLAKPAVTAKAGTSGQMPATDAGAADIAGLRRDITQMQNMLSGLVLTDLDGVNPRLSASTRLELQRAGFSAASLDLLKARYAGMTYEDGCDAFPWRYG